MQFGRATRMFVVSRERCIRALALVTFTLGAFFPFAAAVNAQTPPAGTEIVNVATGNYTTANGTAWSSSNPVNTEVLPVFGISLSPAGTVAAPAYTLAGVAGDTLYCRFTLDNLGNARDSVSVAYQLVPPTTVGLDGLIFFRDANANGRFDTGEDDPAFLAFNAGGVIDLDVAAVVAVGSGPGDSYVEISATSQGDPSTAHTSVFRVTNQGGGPVALHIGPAGNAMALPGGEGTGDDESAGTIGYTEQTFVFDNDVYNGASYGDAVGLSLADSVTLPPLVVVTFMDSTGVTFPQSPSNSDVFLMGAIAPGETRRIQLSVSAIGQPLHRALPSNLRLPIVARSTVDTTRVNTTTDIVRKSASADPVASLSINQTFREPRAAVGDVVTLVVNVTNITDSMRVDSVIVFERIDPQLDFMNSPDFSVRNGRLAWRAGSLEAGQSRRGVAKFVANARKTQGKAHAFGDVEGRAESGERVMSGPAQSSIRIDNDVFAQEGVIFGDVFVDTNEDGVRGADEAGLPGAAVYVESGEYAVTDSLGRFTIPRAFAGYRAVRLDESTLPPDIQFAAPLEGMRDAPRDNQQIVHLLPGGNARVSFGVRRKPPPKITVDHALTCQERVSITQRARLYEGITLPSSNFGLGRAELMSSAARSLGPIVAFLESHPGWGVFVEGHTDSIPIHTKEFPSNMELSIARAEAVRLELLAAGVDDDRIVLRGYGDTRPVASNESINGRRLNRRVEVSFIPPGTAIPVDPQARVPGTIRDLSVLPDTFQVRLRWEVTSTSTYPVHGTLQLHLPPQLKDADVSLRLGGRPLTGENGVYDVAGLARTASLRCLIAFAGEAGDTVAVRDIRAVLHVRLPGDGAPESGEEVITIKPFARGNSAATTKVFDLAAWQNTTVDGSTPVVKPAGVAPPDSMPGGMVAPAPDSGFGIVEPSDKAVFSSRDQVTVRARVPVGSRSVLFVGAEPVDEAHVGQRTIDLATKVEIVTWYGVEIRPGFNQVQLRAYKLDGGILSDSIDVALASQPAILTPRRSRHLVPADGHTRAAVRFDLRDGLGLPVMDGLVATVVEGAEHFTTPDARPGESGLQVATTSGYLELQTKPRGETGHARVVVEYQNLRAESEIVFVPPQRPMLATGVVDLRVGVYDTHGDGSPVGVENFRQGIDAGAEGRVFVQGEVGSGVSVTARLDSRQRFEDPLLKDTDPERQYPIYGDASTLVYAAPSQAGNYVSLDRGESYLRYGDFRTSLGESEFLNYQRAATGVTSALVDGSRRVDAFLTKTDFTTHKDEIPADGTSGFYYLESVPIVENSERIVLETRDRFQTERVLRVVPMIRNQDYTVNPFDGSLLFKEPVDAYDREFNPVRIVVTYEVESQDVSKYLYGLRGSLTEGRRYRASTAAIVNSGDGEDWALFGIDGGLSLGDFEVSGEVARSDDDGARQGNAFRVEANYDAKLASASAYLRRVDGDFNNPSFHGSGTELSSLKAGFKARLRVSDLLWLDADGYSHELHRTNERRESVLGMARYRYHWLEAGAGARVASHDKPSETTDGILSVAAVRLGADDKLGVSTVWEKNLGNEAVEDFPDRVKTLVAVPFADGYRAVASHEYLTAPSRPGSHQVTAGVEGDITRTTRAYTKYSLNRAAGDGRMGAVSGIDQRVRLSAGVSATLGLEGLRSLENRESEEYVSFKSGLNVRMAGTQFAESQYEYRWQRSRRRHMLRLNGAHQAGDGIAVLTKNVLSFADVTDGNNELSYQGVIAGSYRPLRWPVSALAMMRNYYEKYTPVDPEAIQWRLVLSSDVNVIPVPDHEVRLKYAFKHVESYSFGASLSTNSDLVLGQYIYRFAHNWDVDVWGRVLSQRGGSVQTGAGFEVGRMVFRSLRLAAGYSINGFEDADVSRTEAWSSGFGVRLQLILSDWLLNDFERIR